MITFAIVSLLIRLVQAQSATFPLNAYWFTDPVNAPFTYFESSITVPSVPGRDWQPLFIWPGLQPLPNQGPNFLPLDNGVLQSPLTLGASCAPNPNNLIASQDSWWISAQYINTYTKETSYVGCLGGNRMTVTPGNPLKIVMELVSGTNTWRQTITNQANSQAVTFEIDLKGQAQAWAEFVMESPNGWKMGPPPFDVTNIVLKTNGTVLDNFCRTDTKTVPGGSLTCAQPVKNGNTCTISICSFNKMSSVPLSSLSSVMPSATFTLVSTTPVSALPTMTLPSTGPITIPTSINLPVLPVGAINPTMPASTTASFGNMTIGTSMIPTPTGLPRPVINNGAFSNSPFIYSMFFMIPFVFLL